LAISFLVVLSSTASAQTEKPVELRFDSREEFNTENARFFVSYNGLSDLGTENGDCLRLMVENINGEVWPQQTRRITDDRPESAVVIKKSSIFPFDFYLVQLPTESDLCKEIDRVIDLQGAEPLDPKYNTTLLDARVSNFCNIPNFDAVPDDGELGC
jgi:hypothetical protein